MKAHILTPGGSVFEGEVEGVQMPGIGGGFEVLKGHSSLVTLLDIGKLVVRTSDDKRLVFAVSGGFTEVNDDLVTILAEEAMPPEKIDTEQEHEKQKEVEAELKELMIDSDEHAAAETKLKKIKNRISIAGY